MVRVWILPSMQVMAAPNRPSEIIVSFWPPWRQTAADVALHCPAMDLIWIVVIAVLVILVFVFVGIYNGLVQSRNRRQLLGAGRCPAQASLRPDPKPGGDGEGLRLPRA